jgi:hypothetical protein
MSFFKSIVVLLNINVILGSCSKNSSSPAPQGQGTAVKHTLSTGAVTVSAISPVSGIVYTAVTISGSNFSTVTADNVVTINGRAAFVNSATPTQLVVTVLPGTTTGTVTVSAGGSSVTAPAAFNVLHLVKTGSLAQPFNTAEKTANPVTALAFDKGGDVYGIQNVSALYYCVFKYTSGVASLLYKTPNDSLNTEQGTGYSDSYQHSLNGLVTDAQGNIYTGYTLTTVRFQTAGPAYTVTNTASVLKITPTGSVSVLASGLNNVYGINITAMAVDPNGNVYMVNMDEDDYSYNAILKITPAGVVSTFYAGSYIIGCITTDKAGNVYADIGDTMDKFTPQGARSVISAPFN